MYRAEVNGLGIFQGVCADQTVQGRMNVCCVSVSEGEQIFLGSQRLNSSVEL